MLKGVPLDPRLGKWQENFTETTNPYGRFRRIRTKSQEMRVSFWNARKCANDACASILLRPSGSFGCDL
jgi:hypothetical protein